MPPRTPKISKEQKLQMYHDLVLTRALDDRAQALYRQGKITGGLFSSLGQEAISIGAAHALEKEDFVAPMIRNSGVVLVRGHSARDIMTQYFARATSPTGGKDNSQHFGDVERTGVVSCISMLATLVPVMAGMALGARLKGETRVAMTFIGDGALSVGDFYEGMNFAAIQNLPLVVIIENNGYAYSTPTETQTLPKNLVDKGLAFGIKGKVGDGNDVTEVYRLTRQAVDAARAGKGPQLLEFKTFRIRGHAVHDPAEYVPPSVLESWKKKDPIERFETEFTEAERAEVRSKVDETVEDAVRFADESPWPEGAEALRGVFEDDSIVPYTPWWEK